MTEQLYKKIERLESIIKQLEEGKKIDDKCIIWHSEQLGKFKQLVYDLNDGEFN